MASALRVRIWANLAILTLLSSLGQGIVFAQTADPVADQGRRAEEFRKAGRWLEAADLYQELARRQPGVSAWQEQARQCKLHHQIARRYSDPGFQQKLLILPLDRSLQLYAEVLTKIQSHYVADVDLGRLLNRGLEQIDLALQNPAFIQASFAVAVPEEALVSYRQSLPMRWSDLSARSRRDAVGRLQAIAIAMQQDLGIGPTSVVMEFVYAACEGLDDYSTFLAPDRFLLEKNLAQTQLAGIGVELQLSHGNVVVAQIVPDGPAARAGLQMNEQLRRIDGLDVQKLSLEEAALRLLGAEKSHVVLEVQGVLDMSPRRLDLVRERFSIPSIDNVRIVEGEPGIGYMHVGLFQSTTLEELDAALTRLVAQGMRALILDLRGNGGGSFEAGVQVADRFIQQGVLVSTRGRLPVHTVVHRTQDDRDLVLPLVVLVDNGTASAAEIVAGAVRDHRRGMLVGQPTAGKGSLQMVYPLRTVSSGVRLTSARFYSPLDVPFQDSPIMPDILVDSMEGTEGEGMESMMSVMQLQQRQFDAALRAARELLMKS